MAKSFNSIKFYPAVERPSPQYIQGNLANKGTQRSAALPMLIPSNGRCVSLGDLLRFVFKHLLATIPLVANKSGKPESKSTKSSKQTKIASSAVERNLEALYPQLAKEWHYERNNPLGLTPANVRPSLAKLVWWTCPRDPEHDYQRTVIRRTDSKNPLGCPYCAGKKADKKNSLAALRPDLANEWHPKLNGELTPEKIGCNYSKKVWWRCKNDAEHEWFQSPSLRQERRPHCPFCTGFLISDANRLSVRFPEIADEWHPTKNRKLWTESGGTYKVVRNLRLPTQLKQRNRRLKPSDLAFNSKEVVWWCCKTKKHEFEMAVEERTLHGRGCPVCAKSSLENENSIAAKYPQVLKLWHPSRNLPTLPESILPGSDFVAWWRCPKNATHVWDAPVYSVVRTRVKNKKVGCPFCVGMRVDPENSLSAKCPEAAKLWDPIENDLTPSEVTVQSFKTAYWRCPAGQDHLWQATISRVVKSVRNGTTGCPFCRGFRTTSENCLQTLYPSVASMWHSTLNGETTPYDVTPGSTKVFHWICETNKKHIWTAMVSSIVRAFNNGSIHRGCPYCSGRVATDENNLLLAHPEVERYWDKKLNSPLEANEVLPKSRRLVWWHCPKHTKTVWQSSVGEFVSSLQRDVFPCERCKSGK